MNEPIETLEIGDRRITVLGTAHVSQASVDQVRTLVREVRPNTVCVEIDEGRFRSVTDPRRWKSIDIYQVIREKRAFLMLSNLVLAAFQRRIGGETGVSPGAEMIAAVEAAKEEGAEPRFCDREVEVTLRRAWSMAGLWGRAKLLAALLSSAFSTETVDASEVEALKERSELDSMMDELADYLPGAKRVLIDERDEYLARRIWESPGPVTLAVVGAGHLPGIMRWLVRLADGEATVEDPAMSRVPPPGLVRKLVPWVIPAIVAGLITWGFIRSGWDGGLQALYRWVLVNGTLSAIGAAIALARPVTIFLSFVAAPITSMNPTIGVGFVSGLIEAVFRKPRIEDMENLIEDSGSVRGFYRNRITRILLVFIFSTIGSAIGTFVALPLLFPGA